jgi:hypothetical protein
MAANSALVQRKQVKGFFMVSPPGQWYRLLKLVAPFFRARSRAIRSCFGAPASVKDRDFKPYGSPADGRRLAPLRRRYVAAGEQEMIGRDIETRVML